MPTPIRPPRPWPACRPRTTSGGIFRTTPTGVSRRRIEPALGPLNGERLPDYFRLDLRVSRRWQTRHGELRFFLDVQNLTNAGNVRGFNVAFETSEMGVRVDKTEKYWGPLFPSFGLRWSF